MLTLPARPGETYPEPVLIVEGQQVWPLPSDTPADAARRERLAFQGRRGGAGVTETTKVQPEEDV